MKTRLSWEGHKFLINNKLTYTEIETCSKQHYGLLMNQRMIQGVFNDEEDVKR